MFAFDENLVGNDKFLGDGENHIVILISLVHVYADAVLAAFESFTKSTDVERIRSYAVCASESELLEFIESVVAYAAFASGATVDGPVV